MIEKEDLILGRWYLGCERMLDSLGCWAGHGFIGASVSFGQILEASEPYYPDNHYMLLPLPGR